MKLLHTADWQIGMKASLLGVAGSIVREKRLAAGRHVIEIAKNHEVDFILVAGDTFEDNAVDRVVVQKVADILDSYGKAVFVIPGNHDPLVPGSVWEHPVWKSATNVHILREESPVEIPGGILFPCPVREKNSRQNPTAWIPPNREGSIRIGLAHGTVEGVRQDEPDYPIPRDAAQRAELNYLALGHWHSYTTYPGADGASYMAYSGTHETTKFGERDSGNVLIVEVPAPDVSPTIRPVRSGDLDWIAIEKDVRGGEDIADIRKYIESLATPDNTLVDIVLSGLLMADERAELNHIEDILSSRFLWGRLDASSLLPSPEDKTWIASLPPGILRDAAMRLRDNPGASPEIAARALTELYAIAVEVSH